MENPLEKINQYIIEYMGDVELITIKYNSTSSKAIAFSWYNKTATASASGTGYDRKASCLESILEKNYGVTNANVSSNAPKQTFSNVTIWALNHYLLETAKEVR